MRRSRPGRRQGGGRHVLRVAGVLFLLLLPFSGSSQPPPAPEAPPGATAESREAARALGEVIGTADQVRDVLAEIRADLLTRTMRASSSWVDEATPVVDQLLMPGFTARRDELAGLLLEPWAARFTPRELRLLRSFFASPLGRHYLRVQPALSREAAQRWHGWSERVFRDIVDNRLDELRAHGVRF